MSSPTSNLVPTINDLKVKLCYICREEERYDDPKEQPPRPWTHPCNCTLVAHEDCLLQWIQIAQATEARAAKALQCPQCGSKYELESDRPLIFQITDAGSKFLRRAGTLVLVVGTATVITLIVTSIYVVCTGYGSWAVRNFIGKEMYDFCLGDDPSRWPWSSYLNLPLLPFSLIMSQFPLTSQAAPGLPLLLAWPNMFNNRRIDDYWNIPENTQKLVNRLSGAPTTPVRRAWPPSPLILGLIGIPIIRGIYRNLYVQVYSRVMGVPPPQYNGWFNRGDGARVNIGEGGQFVIRVQARGRDGAPPENGAGAGPNAEAPANPPADPQERLVELQLSTLGQKIGGALLIPVISNWMGQLLLRLSKHSSLLRGFLAVRHPVGNVWVPPPVDFGPNFMALSALQKIAAVARFASNGLLNGAPASDGYSDPIWWRNTVGLGVFVVAKDCVQLLHLYLKKKELASRRVKNRDFSGIDLNTLELVPQFLSRLGR